MVNQPAKSRRTGGGDPRPSVVQAAEGPSRRVLIVDDDFDIRRSYGRLLDRLGFSVTEAEDGHDGLARLTSEGFDAVLADVNMEGFDGIDFLKSVRERGLEVPVVLMTASTSFPQAASAIEYGVFRFLQKPVHAYEALVRSDEPALSNPGLLFDAAIKLGRLQELGRTIRRDIAAAAGDAPDECLLFVNVHSAELNVEDLFSQQTPLAAFANKVVFEVTERSTLDRVEDLAARIGRLRALGYRIAIDDLGAGYAGLASFWRLEPDYVKLDLSMISGIHMSSRKRSLIRGIAQIIARDLAVQVVCEGIENVGERDVLAADGLDLMQGYLFARPSRGFARPGL